MNNKLKELCKTRNIKFLHSYRPFTKACKPLRELFAVRDQGLHLNFEGTRRLRQFFYQLRGTFVERVDFYFSNVLAALPVVRFP